jgi:uncharacterized protein YdhG (YjbR/CyaY superfamily)
MQSKATTVDAYLAELPADRRDALSRLRALIKKHAPGATEAMAHGMPAYSVGELLFGLASQKQYLALYVCETDVVVAHRARLGKLDCGKSCIRFKKLADLPLDVVTDIVAEAYHKRA